MKLAAYAHPWDLRALAGDGGLSRLADLGYSEIALAVSYHAGRWLLPWSPEGAVRFLEDGTVHYRPRGDYGELQPLASSEVAGGAPSPLEWLCEHAAAAGLRARAWAVGTHNSRLGALHPARCVINAFGDRYRYALCPAQPTVQHYLRAMVADLAGHAGLSAIEIEAFSWMGWKHSSHHEKASLVPDPTVQELLSLCFCEACRGGTGPDRGRELVASWLRDRLRAECAIEPLPRVTALPQDLQDVLAAARRVRARVDAGTLAAARRARVGRGGSSVALALQVHPSATFRGSQMAWQEELGDVLDGGDEVVLTAYGAGVAGVDALLASMPAGAPRSDGRPTAARRLCVFPRAPEFGSDGDLRALREVCAGHGVEHVSIYHLGLLPWRTVERVARVLCA